MATPAQPILASTLWTGDQVPGKEAAKTQGKLETGLRDIDEAIASTVQYGQLCCISAKSGSGEQEFSTAYLASHLLSSSTASATIIDTGSFVDLRKLHKHIVDVLETQGDATKKALAVLDRLKIMKVFDFEGLADGLSELRQSLQQHLPGAQMPQIASNIPRGTVPDSEDEDEHGDEMLDVGSPVAGNPVPIVQKTATPRAATSSLLLIDNLDKLVAPLTKVNYTQGQALLTSFMQSLANLTKAHNICSILVSGTISYANAREESPSIFTSCKQRPALGKAFMHLLDSHLLVHQMPRSSSERDLVSVVEVLQNRSGKCYGRWAPFVVNNAGQLKGVT